MEAVLVVLRYEDIESVSLLLSLVLGYVVPLLVLCSTLFCFVRACSTKLSVRQSSFIPQPALGGGCSWDFSALVVSSISVIEVKGGRDVRFWYRGFRERGGCSFFIFSRRDTVA